MTRVRCRAAIPLLLLLLCFIARETFSSDLFTYSINTKKWSHVLDDHFISVTINPTDLLQGKAFGLGMNSTVAILKGLSPAYIRIGSADTGKYTFKRSRYPSDVARTEDEFIITESHWTTLHDVVRSAGLDVIVCLNAAHRNGASNKWDTRNSLELISFSDSQGYNLTFQLGYEVQRSSGLSGHQYGKDLKRLRTILNAFPRYQNSKLIGPDIRYLQKKDDVDFVNDVLLEAGSVLDAVTWHPRWPQPSKMKVSDVSELGYEFPTDYIEWDRSQLGRILQRSIFKNSIWIGEPKTESTGTFAEGLLWARRLVLAAKLGIEVVMKQPSLMDISHPKPEYWIAFLHKRLLGKAVLETRPVNNHTDIAVITHCTNPLFWSEKSNKAFDGAVTVYAVNMGGKDQRVYIKGAWGGKSQIMLQYLLTSGSDPDSVFSQMTYLNGEPLMMTDDGHLPDITPRVRRIDRGVLFKLPPYSVGFWVIPDAKVKICQTQPTPIASPNLENHGVRHGLKNLPNIRNLNQLIVDKLKNPVSESDEEFYDDRTISDFSGERDLIQESAESPAPRASRRVRQITVEDIGQELKDKIREIRDMLEKNRGSNIHPSETLRAAEEKITSLTEELGAATRLSNQQKEFRRFLHQSGLNEDFGALMMNDRTGGLSRSIRNNPLIKPPTTFDPFEATVRRFRRSLSSPEDDYEEESTESYSSEEEAFTEAGPNWKVNYRKRIPGLHEVSDESGDNSGYSGSPVLKGIEDKYKNFFSHRIQDGKRKLSDLKRQKTRKNEEESRKPNGKKSNTLENDLQEEILMKEVEVLQKTEEAMANLIKNHKKRQQTIQEIILHEISDIKENRLSALEDIRQKKELNGGGSDENQEDIPKKMRNVAEILHFPQKTKRSIGESDTRVNALPEEEKKSKIVKRSVDSSYEKSLRRKKSRKSNRDEDESSRERGDRRHRKSRSERLERMKNFIQSRERIRDRNMHRKKHNRNLRKHKFDGSDEESNEVLSNYGNDYLGKSEDMVIKEIRKEVLKKPERSEENPAEGEMVKKGKNGEERGEESNKTVQKEQKSDDNYNNNHNNNKEKSEKSGGGNDGRVNSSQSNTDSQKNKPKTEEKSQQESTTAKPIVKKVKTEEHTEYTPVKIDKNRGLHVLKRISNLVESINTREKSKSRKPSTDVEDLSEEFFGDSISRLSKRRHRRSHHHGDEVEMSEGEEQMEETPVKSLKELKALRKEIKLRKLLERRMRKKKLKEQAQEEDQTEGESVKSRPKAEQQEKQVTETSSTEGVAIVAEEGPQLDARMEEVVTEDAQEQIVAEPKDNGIKTEDKEEEEPHEVTTESEVERVAAKETPEAIEREESSLNEEVAEPKDVESEKEDATTEQVPQDDAEKARDKVAAVLDEKVDETSEAKPQEKTEIVNTAEEDPQSEQVEKVSNSTEAPIADAITEAFGTSSKKTEPIVEESPEEPNTALVLPEDLAYDPLVMANPEEEIGIQEEEPNETKGDRYILFDQYLQHEAPQHELYGESTEEEDTGPPDLISELLEGEKLKPWKGAIMDTVQDLKTKINGKKSNQKRRDTSEQDETSATFENPAGHYGSAKESYLVQMPRDSSEEGSDIADPSIMEAVPTETIYTKIPEKRSLRRTRRGIFERRQPTPEERIRSFKRMVHRRHSPFGHRNEVPIINEGENFWKMAGSTVKAVFNDVIPDAYGKTKDKIANLGIAEYFKEFGKIVEQMKNLDKIFANIGQAAVRNYIKGSEGEKGDYIQVIDKRRRSRRDVEDILKDKEEKEVVTEVNTTPTPEVTTVRTTEKAIPTTARPLVTNIRAKGLRNYVKERPNDLIRDIFLMDSNPGIVEVTRSPPTTEQPQTVSLQPFESRYAKVPRVNNRLLNRPTEMEKFAPWMKTTKEFINQALTTLQRQRELSEMIARESVNDLVKREIQRKVIGKRETGEDRRIFPVYQMPVNRKREIYDHPEETLTRYPNHLQPGVYIVPTEEMQNLRSEQIMKEAPTTKPGVPNMVTLNIYYDKKKPQAWETSKEEVVPAGKLDADFMRYYQEPTYSWNPVPPVNHGPEYLPEPTMETRYLPQQPFPTEPKLHYGEQYHEWVPRGYPPALPRTQPYLYPETQYTHPKIEWQEARHPDGSLNGESGWAVQFQPTKKKAGRSRESLRTVDRQQRLLPDKKRSVGSKADAGFPGLALPFWKFEVPKNVPVEKTANLESGESLEELFAENRKRAKLNESKQKQQKPGEAEKDMEEEEEDEEEEEKMMVEKSEAGTNRRRRRDLSQPMFQDIDMIPEWFGTIQELDNNLHEYQNELERMTRVVGLPWSDYEEEDAIPLAEIHRMRRSLDEGKKVLKKLDDADSSLEVPTVEKNSTNSAETTNATNGSGDPFSQFFKYAYASLAQMMKQMTGFI